MLIACHQEVRELHSLYIHTYFLCNCFLVQSNRNKFQQIYLTHRRAPNMYYHWRSVDLGIIAMKEYPTLVQKAIMWLNRRLEKCNSKCLVNRDDCILYRWVKPVLGMSQNCIWWWGSSPGDLGSVENPLNAITPCSSLTQSRNTYKAPFSGSNQSVFKLFLLDRTVQKKKKKQKTLKKLVYKKPKNKYTMNIIP